MFFPLVWPAAPTGRRTARTGATPRCGRRQTPAAYLTEAELAAQLVGDARQIRVLTGDRPTGPLHLGHYLGSLRNRVRLQDAGADMFVLVADYQVITDRDASASIADFALGLVADYLAVGLDPARSTVFAHSAVPAAEPAAAAADVPDLGPGAGAQPHHQGRGRRLRAPGAVGADAHLPGAPGRRHPVLPLPTWSRSARTSCRTWR